LNNIITLIILSFQIILGQNNIVYNKYLIILYINKIIPQIFNQLRTGDT
jgi:hypothetical protein